MSTAGSCTPGSDKDLRAIIESFQEDLKALREEIQAGNQKHDNFERTVEQDRAKNQQQLVWLGLGVQKQADAIPLFCEKVNTSEDMALGVSSSPGICTHFN